MGTNDIELLLSEREIINLTVRYAWSIDHRRFEQLAGIFAPDATADYGRLGTFHGPDAIAGAVARALTRFDRTQHLVSNHQVSLNGDAALGQCYFQARHITHRDAGDEDYVVAGEYLDHVRRTEQGWRITSRVLRVAWRGGTVPDPEPVRSDRQDGGKWMTDTTGIQDTAYDRSQRSGREYR